MKVSDVTIVANVARDRPGGLVLYVVTEAVPSVMDTVLLPAFQRFQENRSLGRLFFVLCLSLETERSFHAIEKLSVQMEKGLVSTLLCKDCVDANRLSLRPLDAGPSRGPRSQTTSMTHRQACIALYCAFKLVVSPNKSLCEESSSNMML